MGSIHVLRPAGPHRRRGPCCRGHGRADAGERNALCGLTAPPRPPTAGPRRRCPARCTRRTTTPAGRAWPTTSPRSTAPPTATAPTGWTWRPRTDTGGGANDLGWTAAGQWFKYTVNVATAGTYTVGLRLASPIRGHRRAAHRQRAGTNLSGDVDRPEHRRLPDLDHGHRDRHPARRHADPDRGPGQQRLEHPLPRLRPEHLGGGGTGEAPYGGTAAAVPGTVQAENYDTGGQGVAYNVTSVNGTANSYRSDGVDLEATTDTGGGLRPRLDRGRAVVQVHRQRRHRRAPTPSSLRLAAPTAVTDALHIANSAGTNLSGNVNAPATGGWQDLDDGHRQRHPARRRADADRRPGQRRLEHPLPDLRHGRVGRRRQLRRVPVRVLGQHQQHPERVGRHRVRLHQRHQRRSTPTARSTGTSTASRSRSPSRRTTR